MSLASSNTPGTLADPATAGIRRCQGPADADQLLGAQSCRGQLAVLGP